jgi:hypothetical protein
MSFAPDEKPSRVRSGIVGSALGVLVAFVAYLSFGGAGNFQGPLIGFLTVFACLGLVLGLTVGPTAIRLLWRVLANL